MTYYDGPMIRPASLRYFTMWSETYVLRSGRLVRTRKQRIGDIQIEYPN